jgi:phage gp36-like protein
MTNYTTADDVRLECGFVDNTDIDDTVIEQYITEAHADILGILATNFDITLLDESNVNFDGSVAHQVLKNIEKYLTSGNLLLKEYGVSIGDNKNEDARARIEKAKKMLDKIAKGEMQLPLNDGEVAVFAPSTGNVRTYSAIYYS